jgi:hypothetical protein
VSIARATVPLEGAAVHAALTSGSLAPVAAAAKQLWIDSGLLSAPQRTTLDAIDIRIGSLGGSLLGATASGQITVDFDAAGHGWFVDPPPLRNEEFNASGQEMTARAGSAADPRVDLLTALAHAIGHGLGIAHDAAGGGDLMDEVLGVGVRRLPISAAATLSPESARMPVVGSQVVLEVLATGSQIASPPSVPVIDFVVRPIGGSVAAAARPEVDQSQRVALDDFPNHLGRPAHDRNSNAGLRITLPAAASRCQGVAVAVWAVARVMGGARQPELQLQGQHAHSPLKENPGNGDVATDLRACGFGLHFPTAWMARPSRCVPMEPFPFSVFR